MKITDFLQTKTSKKKLEMALQVINEFKACEGKREWFSIPFMAWEKLEQLEEFLEYLVNGKPLKLDTLRYMSDPKR